MDKKILYVPVYKPTENSKNRDWFQVNGAADYDRDSAIRKGNQHIAVKTGDAILARVDEIEQEYNP